MIILENNYGKIRCQSCDSVFQLEKGDLRHVFSDTDDDAYIVCPVCGELKWYRKDHPYVKASETGIMTHK